MSAQPPSDDSQLPHLRRFRFDSNSGKVPREVDPAAAQPQSPATELATDQDGTREIPASHRAEADELRDGDAGAFDEPEWHGDPGLDDPDRVLADADRALDRTVHERTSTPPSPGAGRVTPPPATPGPELSRPDRPGHSVPSGANGRPPSGPPSAPASTDAPNRPSSVPWLIAGIAAAAVIALVVWLVTSSGSDDEADADGSGPQSGTATEAVETGAWADGVCQQLTAYETAAMPLKAEATKAAAATGGAFSAEAAKDMQREAGELLSDLSTALGELPAPSDESVAAVHDQLLTDVAETAESTQASGNGAIGSPRDTAADVVASLGVPVEAFLTATDELTDEQFEPIAATASCSGLL